MDSFLARFGSFVDTVLTGFDRLVFRGSLLQLIRPRGMYSFLNRAGVRLLDFGNYARTTSERVKAASFEEARQNDRPTRYLQSAKTSKEKLARTLLKENPTEQGLICVLSAVEPCTSFEYHRSSDPKERGLKPRRRKCLHLYKYYLHPEFGFMNCRLQTWFPFSIQICLNGREWLATQLKALGQDDYLRDDNCFISLADPELAQTLMNKQLETDWPKALTQIARALNPLHPQIFKPWPIDYYWSAYQTEWATDLLFKSPQDLERIYPALVRHAMTHFSSPDVMRFLGRKAHGNFLGELTSSFKDRPEGVRVKHWVSGNSIKMYDKAGSVLRVETTIAKTSDFKAFRPKQSDPQGPSAWRPMRKGIADLYRRTRVSQKANETYLEALAVVDDSDPIHKLLDNVSRRVTYRGHKVRALRIGDPLDVSLLQAISRGEFATAGFRNRDLRPHLFPAKKAASPEDRRRQSAKVTRLLRLLRAHGIIRKIPKSHRYRVTLKGHRLTAAVSATRAATLKQLIGTAA